METYEYNKFEDDYCKDCIYSVKLEKPGLFERAYRCKNLERILSLIKTAKDILDLYPENLHFSFTEENFTDLGNILIEINKAIELMRQWNKFNNLEPDSNVVICFWKEKTEKKLNG